MFSQKYQTPFPVVLGFFASGGLLGCHAQCETPWYADLDGDGFGDRSSIVTACDRPEAYVPDASDCDDTQGGVHPGADDLCNGVDDNCDGQVDAGAVRWFVDADRDGIGTTNHTVTACTPPDGYVAAAGDCDDGDPRVFPGAPVELCDGVDQDCDGLVDEGALGDDRWYPDDDQDGYGDALRGLELCAPPSDWVDNGDDCDDFDSTIHPGASERCDSNIDNDCDGDADLDDKDAPVLDTIVVYEDADLDNYGHGAGELVCEKLIGMALDDGDCDDTDNLVSPDADEVCNGVDDDCDNKIDDEDPSLDDSTQVLAYADVDGDGLGDPLASIQACAIGDGAANNALDCDDGDAAIGPDLWLLDSDGDGAGAGTLVSGSACAAPGASYVNANVPPDCDDTDDLVFPGAVDRCGDGIDQDCTAIDPACGVAPDGLAPLEAGGRAFGSGEAAGDAYGTLAAGGDLTGDGVNDVVVGAPGPGGTTPADGRVYLLPGPPPEFPGEWTPALSFSSGISDASFGAAVAIVGDGALDGYPDLLVGAPDAPGPGQAFTYELHTGVPVVRMTITGTGDAGTAVSDGENLDGALPEIVIGAPQAEQVAMLANLQGSKPFATAGLLITGPGGSGDFGYAVECCGGGDGLVVGAPIQGASAGAVWVFDPLDTGSLTASLVALAEFTGTNDDQLGTAIATNGDFDNDGVTDVAGTAPFDSAGGNDAGAAYVWTAHAVGQGDTVAAVEVRGDTALATLGQSVALGDIDGDDQDDLLLGATSADVGGTDAGAVYVFFGPATGVHGAITADAILYGPAGAKAGSAMRMADIDPDDGTDLLVTLPNAGTGTVWLLPGLP